MKERLLIKVGRNAIVERVGESHVEYVVALNYDAKDGTWGQGKHFTSWSKEENEVFEMLYEAVKCFEKYMD